MLRGPGGRIGRRRQSQRGASAYELSSTSERPGEAEPRGNAAGASERPCRTIRAMVIDDSALMRSAVAAMLRKQADIEVVAEAGSRDEALAQIAAIEPPDVVVLDLRLGRSSRDGIELAAVFREIAPGARIVIYSSYLADNYVETLSQLNVHGYVLKTDHPNAMIEAVRAAALGGVFLSPDVYARLSQSYGI
ncbi:MAG: response regulator transcription factor [Chloroflexi bacterium]|nr:response regulator transcription factor [Chloroflexota bacterium]